MDDAMTVVARSYKATLFWCIALTINYKFELYDHDILKTSYLQNSYTLGLLHFNYLWPHLESTLDILNLVFFQMKPFKS